MQKQKNISGAMLRRMLQSAAKLLDNNKAHVDALNVFPVPDGDTGTNMSLTMLSALKEVNSCATNNIVDVANAMSKGALRGARGNSGVILSQIFKGMANVFVQEDTDITPHIMADALKAGMEVAYRAVTKPKEGTILTIIRAIAEHAVTLSKNKDIDMGEYFRSLIEHGENVLEATPEMLPVLKKAGVVDAGGRGLLIIFTGFYNAISGNDTVEVLEFDDTYNAEAAVTAEAAAPKTNNYMQFHAKDLGAIEHAYCTEFFIINLHKKTTEADIDRFREKLMAIGDCVLVIGDLELVKVHIHTNTPNEALGYGLELGELDNLKIENMLQQNRALMKKQEEQKPIGMVAVCAGQGFADIFKDLLVDRIVEGGQTMNPSAADIAKAVDSVNAQNVIVFPNNKNIILAAEQAKELTDKNIFVVPTINVPQGVACALCFDPDAEVSENIEAMQEAMNSVKAGQVTYAVRSAKSESGMELKKGDIIGIDTQDIVAKGDDVEQVTKELIDKMMDEDVSNITLYFGSDVKEDEAQKIVEDLRKKYTRCDVDSHYGGQPLYYYIVSLE